MYSRYLDLYEAVIDRNKRELGYRTLIESHNSLYLEKLKLEGLNRELRLKLLKYEETYDSELTAELLMRDNYF